MAMPFLTAWRPREGMSQVLKNQIGINFTQWKMSLFIHKGAWVGAWNVSPNNSETVGHKYLRLGQIVVFYNISFSWLLPLDGFQFILRDNENDLLIPWFLMISVILNSVNQQFWNNVSELTGILTASVATHKHDTTQNQIAGKISFYNV